MKSFRVFALTLTAVVFSAAGCSLHSNVTAVNTTMPVMLGPVMTVGNSQSVSKGDKIADIKAETEDSFMVTSQQDGRGNTYTTTETKQVESNYVDAVLLSTADQNEVLQVNDAYIGSYGLFWLSLAAADAHSGIHTTTFSKKVEAPSEAKKASKK